MNTPLITTIITTYKRPKLLKRAIESVLSQTYPNFQVCVYDNASGDETADVVKELQKKDPRLHYHCHPENLGMMGNYQYAFSKVNTPFFSVLSDDDMVLPTFLETTLKGFEKHPDVYFSAASSLIVSKNREIITSTIAIWKREGYFSPPDGVIEIIGKWFPPTAVLYRQQVLKEIPIEFSNELLWDNDLLTQIASRFPFFISGETGGIFLCHDDSFSGYQSPEHWKESICKMMKRVKEDLYITDEVRLAITQKLQKFLKARLVYFIRYFILQKNLKKARETIRIYQSSYGQCFQTLFFIMLIKACFYFPPVHFLVDLIKKIRWISKKKNSRGFQNILPLISPLTTDEY